MLTITSADTRLNSVLELQKKAFADEGAVTLAVRTDRLDRLIQLSVENAQAITEATRHDYGGARSMHTSMMSEIFSKVGGMEHSRDQMADWMQPEPRVTLPPFDVTGATSEVVYQPKGVVGIISPWNMPFGLTVAPLTSVLAAGNRAMIKPSELTPRTSDLMATLFARYFAEDEVAVVTGGADVGAAFAGLAFDHLLFTGSSAVGRNIMRAAAENLTPVTLELGGKCPVIVGASATMPMTASTLGFGKMMNGGQLCLSPDYALVPRDMEEAFVATLIGEIVSMFPTVAGNPDHTGAISSAHLGRLRAHIADARDKGAKITVVGSDEDAADGDGFRLPFHILQNVTADMTVMQEEIFGPVLPIVPYDGIAEAIAFVEAGARPLGLYYFGEDKAEEARVLAHTHSGGVTVNDVLQHYVQDNLPFGGIGASGMGAYHGRDGFLTFSHARAVFRQGSQPMVAMFRPPFTPELQGFLDSEIRRRTVGSQGTAHLAL